MNVFCLLLFLGALLGFLLSVFYSVTTPVAVWGCQYLNESISSQFGFQSKF